MSNYGQQPPYGQNPYGPHNPYGQPQQPQPYGQPAPAPYGQPPQPYGGQPNPYAPPQPGQGPQPPAPAGPAGPYGQGYPPQQPAWPGQPPAPPRPQLVERSVIVVTLDAVPGRVVTGVVGDVVGVVARSRELPRELRTPNPAEGYAQMLTRSRQEAVDAMVEMATAAGADAVLGLRYDCSEITQSLSEVSAYGTAVTLGDAVPGAGRTGQDRAGVARLDPPDFVGTADLEDAGVPGDRSEPEQAPARPLPASPAGEGSAGEGPAGQGPAGQGSSPWPPSSWPGQG